MRSVTVTSFTDVFAFGVGAFTQMPGLQSFCVCTAIALGCIYVLQVRGLPGISRKNLDNTLCVHQEYISIDKPASSYPNFAFLLQFIAKCWH